MNPNRLRLWLLPLLLLGAACADDPAASAGAADTTVDVRPNADTAPGGSDAGAKEDDYVVLPVLKQLNCSEEAKAADLAPDRYCQQEWGDSYQCVDGRCQKWQPGGPASQQSSPPPHQEAP